MESCCRQSLMITMINYSGRASEVLSTYLTDDGPVYYALSVHRYQAKVITRFAIDMPYAKTKFSKCGDRDKVPEGSTLFEDKQISF